MLYNPQAAHVKSRQCRHCGQALQKPIREQRKRFCCGKCEEGFYRIRCRVCERPINPKNSRRQLCDRPKCAAAFRREKERFLPSRYPSAGLSSKREETLTKGWRQVAGPPLDTRTFQAATIPLDPELTARHARDLKAIIAERDRKLPAPLIGPHDTPVNIIGGCKFPDAPKINLEPPAAPPKATTTRNDLLVPNDLSVPALLRRVQS
jgi:hypothetical protein